MVFKLPSSNKLLYCHKRCIVSDMPREQPPTLLLARDSMSVETMAEVAQEWGAAARVAYRGSDETTIAEALTAYSDFANGRNNDQPGSKLNTELLMTHAEKILRNGGAIVALAAQPETLNSILTAMIARIAEKRNAAKVAA
jgi:hypothetical protein